MVKNKSAKQIQKHLRQALVFDAPMSQTLYDWELAELLDEFRRSLIADHDEFLFALTENAGKVAMVLIERSGAVHVNEQARWKLKKFWKAAYVSNLNQLLPQFAEELDAGEIVMNGVKTALEA